MLGPTDIFKSKFLKFLRVSVNVAEKGALRGIKLLNFNGDRPVLFPLSTNTEAVSYTHLTLPTKA